MVQTKSARYPTRLLTSKNHPHWIGVVFVLQIVGNDKVSIHTSPAAVHQASLHGTSGNGVLSTSIGQSIIDYEPGCGQKEIVGVVRAI